jgi:hypothetical protein
LEAFIRNRVGKIVLEAAQSDGYVSSVDRTIAKLFGIPLEPKGNRCATTPYPSPRLKTAVTAIPTRR